MFGLASELTEDTMPLTLVEHVWGKKMTGGQGYASNETEDAMDDLTATHSISTRLGNRN